MRGLGERRTLEVPASPASDRGGSGEWLTFTGGTGGGGGGGGGSGVGSGDGFDVGTERRVVWVMLAAAAARSRATYAMTPR